MTAGETTDAPSIDARLRDGLKDTYVAARATFHRHKNSTRAGLEAEANDALYNYGRGVEAAVQQNPRFERVGIHGESIVYANTKPESFPLGVTHPHRIHYSPNSVFFVVNTSSRGENRYLFR